MAKYDAVFKRKVVKEYLEGKVGYSLLAKKYGIPSKKQVQKWVNQFKQYGENGLERKRTKKTYSSQFKMDVLHYMKRTGASLFEAGNTFGIHEPSLIAAWEKKYREGGREALSKPKGRPSINRNKKPKRAYKKKELTREQQLEREIELLKIENEYLKKLRAFQMNPDSLGKRKP